MTQEELLPFFEKAIDQVAKGLNKVKFEAGDKLQFKGEIKHASGAAHAFILRHCCNRKGVCKWMNCEHCPPDF